MNFEIIYGMSVTICFICGAFPFIKDVIDRNKTEKQMEKELVLLENSFLINKFKSGYIPEFLNEK